MVNDRPSCKPFIIVFAYCISKTKKIRSFLTPGSDIIAHGLCGGFVPTGAVQQPSWIERITPHHNHRDMEMGGTNKFFVATIRSFRKISHIAKMDEDLRYEEREIPAQST